MSQKTWDAIVIGTGIGGLSAGLTLAQQGRSVLLLEAGKQFGGMLNPFARKKYHFDVGIHYVGEAGPGGSMRRALDQLGLEDLKFREINPDCIDRYVFGDYENRLVKGLDRWVTSLASDFPGERDAIMRFGELMRACQEIQRLAMGKVKRQSVQRVLRRAPDLLRSLRYPLKTLLDRNFRDPYLKAAFAGPGGDIGLPPSRAGAYVSLMVLNHFLGGAYYPIGGSGAVRDGFVKKLRAKGAELLRNTTVAEIHKQAHGFQVTTTGGATYRSRVVVSNADGAHTVDMLRGAQPDRWTRRKAKNLVPSLGSFCMFLGTDLDIEGLGLTDANIWHYGTPDIERGYAPALSGRMPQEAPFFFLTAPTLKDPETTRAPKGHHTVELITFVPSKPFKPWFSKPAMKRGADYEALKSAFAEQLLGSAETYLPGIRDHIHIKESATPATVWHFVRGRNGGIYGPEHSPEQSFPRRLFTGLGVEGLFQAGASVFGAGIQPCLMSGMLAGDKAESYLKRNANGRASGWRHLRTPSLAA